LSRGQNAHPRRLARRRNLDAYKISDRTYCGADRQHGGQGPAQSEFRGNRRYKIRPQRTVDYTLTRIDWRDNPALSDKLAWLDHHIFRRHDRDWSYLPSRTTSGAISPHA